MMMYRPSYQEIQRTGMWYMRRRLRRPYFKCLNTRRAADQNGRGGEDGEVWAVRKRRNTVVCLFCVVPSLFPGRGRV